MLTSRYILSVDSWGIQRANYLNQNWGIYKGKLQGLPLGYSKGGKVYSLGGWGILWVDLEKAEGKLLG